MHATRTRRSPLLYFCVIPCSIHCFIALFIVQDWWDTYLSWWFGDASGNYIVTYILLVSTHVPVPDRETLRLHASVLLLLHVLHLRVSNSSDGSGLNILMYVYFSTCTYVCFQLVLRRCLQLSAVCSRVLVGWILKFPYMCRPHLSMLIHA
jgi:hypothetical protein